MFKMEKALKVMLIQLVNLPSRQINPHNSDSLNRHLKVGYSCSAFLTPIILAKENKCFFGQVNAIEVDLMLVEILLWWINHFLELCPYANRVAALQIQIMIMISAQTRTLGKYGDRG
jgi:hypothetical protein